MMYRFVIANFGSDKFKGMLLTLLFSIKQLKKENIKVAVFWQDMQDELMDDFKKSFPEVEFIKTNFIFGKSNVERISSKVKVWNYAANYFKGEKLCLIDSDMLVLKDIENFFVGDFDIGFTFKKEKFPLNTGTILAKGDKAVAFFEHWLEKTISIIQDKRDFAKANDPNLSYGAADQMALYQILNYDKEKTDYEINFSSEVLKLKGFDCEELNETNSRQITDKTHIIHFKSGWQPILLEGLSFTKKRKKRDSWQMYLLYLKKYQRAVTRLNNFAGKRYSLDELGIKIPFYFKISEDGEFIENVFLYQINLLRSFFIRFFKKIKIIFKKYGLGKI